MRTTSSELLTKGSLTVMQERVEVVDFGGWSIRNWRALAGLTSALLVVSGGLAGSITDYRSYFPALGGPNGLLYDLTLKVAQPWRRNIPTAPAGSGFSLLDAQLTVTGDVDTSGSVRRDGR